MLIMLMLLSNLIGYTGLGATCRWGGVVGWSDIGFRLILCLGSGPGASCLVKCYCVVGHG